jgi:exodeoxyribonuclease-5
LEADVVLTAKNKTRNIFNSKIRDLKGSRGKLPNVGDKLICRKNQWNINLNGIPLTNGTLGRVVNPIRKSDCDLTRGIYAVDFQPDWADDFEYYEGLRCDYDFLIEPCGNKEINKFNFGCKLEYGESLTVHIAQGSQYNNVVYWDEFVGDEEYMRRLRYTAVTRAVKKVYMFI